MSESEIIFLVESDPEGGFNARALGASIFTQADTFEDLKEAVRDAVLCHFDEGQAPKLIRLHQIHDTLIAV
ncbi:MAG: hypothetical protein U0P81_06760 [Holophagaceae bacterium]